MTNRLWTINYAALCLIRCAFFSPVLEWILRPLFLFPPSPRRVRRGVLVENASPADIFLFQR